MGNEITGKYFEQEDFSTREREVLQEVCSELDFTPEVEIFRGVIYDADKVGSLIYRGKWNSSKPIQAVLKLQGLQPEVDEIDVLQRFGQQSHSERVRLPHLYAGQHWNAEKGYGYLLLEYINAPQIYTHPFANEKQITAFCDFYQEYRNQALQEAFFPQTENELDTVAYTTSAVKHWTTVALAQREARLQEVGSPESAIVGVEEQDIALTDVLLKAMKQTSYTMGMEFQHAHLSADDIFDMGESDNGHEYVLMSNLFWGYRPQWYDTTFHLWAGIKALRDTTVGFDDVLAYLEKWLAAYKQLPVIASDRDFESKFWLLLAGRAFGALLLDIHNQNYDLPGGDSFEYKQQYVTHLQDIFRQLFHVSIKRSQL